MTVPAEHCTLNFFSFVFHSGPDSATFGFHFFLPPYTHPMDVVLQPTKSNAASVASTPQAYSVASPGGERLLKMGAFISNL
jgi:hypothetical protein